LSKQSSVNASLVEHRRPLIKPKSLTTVGVGRGRNVEKLNQAVRDSR